MSRYNSKIAALVAAGASSILNRTKNLNNYGYEEDETPSEIMNDETGTLNKNGIDCLNDLYKYNQKFRDENINFVGDKAGLSNEKILDKRYKYNSLNKLGTENLTRFVWSRDYTIGLIENLVSFKVEF